MLENFELFLRTLTAKLSSVFRWKGLAKQGDVRENVLVHSYKMAWIVQLLLSYEEVFGNKHRLNYYKLLSCAVNHDIAESIIGDISLPEKTDADSLEEKKAFEVLIDQNVPMMVRKFFPVPIDLDPKANQWTKKFWQACEQIGYCLYAMQEIQEGKWQYAEVLEREKKSLENLGRFFPSVLLVTNHIFGEYHRVRNHDHED